MMTKEKSYPQLLLARATDRERSFLRRSAWILGYILLGIAMILCAMLWAIVKEIFQDWTTPGKQPEPEPEDPLVYDLLDDEFLHIHDYRREHWWNKKPYRL